MTSVFGHDCEAHLLFGRQLADMELCCAGPLAGLLKSEPAEAEPVADGPAAQSKQGKTGQETKKTS